MWVSDLTRRRKHDDLPWPLMLATDNAGFLAQTDAPLRVLDAAFHFTRIAIRRFWCALSIPNLRIAASIASSAGGSSSSIAVL